MAGFKSFPKEMEMKKNLPFFIFFGALIIFYVFLTKQKPNSVYLSPYDKISKEEIPKSDHKIFDLISRINQKSSEIQSLYLENMSIKFQQNFISFKANGEIAMLKDKNFRLKISSNITGKEMDIGSNDELFWFWSKRMNPPYLHYANHKDLHKTMLRTALNPNWMMESLNVQEIKKENIMVAYFKNFYVIIQNRISANSEKVTLVLLLDPQKETIVGRYLYDANGKMIASTEYENGTGIVPNKIFIQWYEENIFLTWDLSKIKINLGINPSYWIMPNMKNSVNMAQ
jgi:hypothetical protein